MNVATKGKVEKAAFVPNVVVYVGVHSAQSSDAGSIVSPRGSEKYQRRQIHNITSWWCPCLCDRTSVGLVGTTYGYYLGSTCDEAWERVVPEYYGMAGIFYTWSECCAVGCLAVDCPSPFSGASSYWILSGTTRRSTTHFYISWHLCSVADSTEVTICTRHEYVETASTG